MDKTMDTLGVCQMIGASLLIKLFQTHKGVICMSCAKTSTPSYPEHDRIYR